MNTLIQEETNMITTKKFVRVVSALLMALCAGAAWSQPVKIRAAYVVPVANWPSILFEKSGLARHMGKSYTFEAIRFQGTPPMITALANNEIEIGDLAFSSFALAVENAGMDDLRVIADEFQDGVPGYYTNEFFVLKDSPIRSVRDLKGKVLATNAAGSAVDIVARSMLRKQGLDDRSDVTIVEAAFPNMKAMLLGKKADLIPGVIPFSLDPQLRGAGRVLFTQKEAVGRTQMIVWVARASFLQKNRAAMVDFMEDAIRAVHGGSRDRRARQQTPPGGVREVVVHQERPRGRLLPRRESRSRSRSPAGQHQPAAAARSAQVHARREQARGPQHRPRSRKTR